MMRELLVEHCSIFVCYARVRQVDLPKELICVDVNRKHVVVYIKDSIEVKQANMCDVLVEARC
jgi:hypothetical protein